MKALFTILLALVTAALTVLTLIQCDRVDLLADFRPKEVLESDSRLFEQDLKTTADITISSPAFADHSFSYQKDNGLWLGSTPWQDRADGPKAVEKLVLFAHNSTIVDHIEATPEHLEKFGFGTESIRVKLSNSLGERIADFTLGKPSAWKKKIEGKQELLIPTVYLRRNSAEHKDTLYLCTDFSGAIHALFENELKGFRDPRPFALNIQSLKEIRMLRSKTEIMLSHNTPTAPWQLKKPLELHTDRKQVVQFLANLSQLEAIALHEPSDVTLPDSNEDTLQITVRNFNSEQETTLTVYPAEKGAGSCYATVSDRKVVFELPLLTTTTVQNHIAQLPESINELRSRNMLHLDKAARADLRSIILRTLKAPNEAVIVARAPGQRYQLLNHNNQKQDLDETVLVQLLTQLTKAPVKDFTSDATSDFQQYGLKKPLIVVDLLSFKGAPQQLRIGKVLKKSAEGKLEEKFFANLRGTPIVWEVASDFVSRIPTRYWDWQPKEIWNLPVIDIAAFQLKRSKQAPITVNYDYLDDSFTASQGESDVSKLLRPSRAKFFLNENHLLKAHKRLSPSHAAARRALETPILSVSFTVNRYDDSGLPSTPSVHTLDLAPVTRSAANAFFYAQSSDSAGYFLFTTDTVRKLAGVDLFDKE